MAEGDSDQIHFKSVIELFPKIGEIRKGRRTRFVHACVSSILAQVLHKSGEIKNAFCIVDVKLNEHGDCIVDPYISALMERVLQRTGLCKDALKQDLSTSSLSKVLLLLDICGASGVLLVFPTATGDDIADSLFTAFTAEDPLVDLRNDFPVLAASSSVNSYKLRQLLMTSREGFIRLVRAQPKTF